MSKELEAIIRKELEKITYTHYEPKRTEDINNAMKVISQSLTPPTADELCAELGDYLKEPVWLDVNNDIRISTQWLVRKIYYEGEYKGLSFLVVLPPTLIKRIAQFYENEVKE